MSSDFEQRLASADRALRFLEKVKQLAVEEKKQREFRLEQEANAWHEETRKET